MKNLMKSMFGWIFDDGAEIGDGLRITPNKCLHQFPNLGSDAAITIDCIVSSTARAWDKNRLANQELDGGIPSIRAQRVGVMVVEVDEYGLHFRWEPHELTQDSFTSPFGRPGGLNPLFKDRPNNGN